MPNLVVGKKEKLFEGPFMQLWGTTFLDKSGQPQVWQWIARKSPVVLVFPVTDNNEVVLVKNFRVPLEQYVIEVPAGFCDKTGESLLGAAERELLEETGFVAETCIPLRPWPYRSGCSNGMINGFIAMGCHKVQEPQLEPTEDLTVVKVPLTGLMHYYFMLPDDVLFQPEILAMKDMAEYLHCI